MRTFMLSTVLLLLTTSIFAQTSFRQTADSPSSEIGLDAYYFINLLRETPSGPFDRHFLTYRLNFENSAIRSGIGFRFQKDLNDLDSISTNNTNANLNFRLGYEWHQNFGKRWQIFYGADGRLRHQRAKSERQLGDSTTTSIATNNILGASPVLGIKFKLNERLTLSTETSYDFDYRVSNSSSSPARRALEVSYNYPTSLYLLIKL